VSALRTTRGHSRHRGPRSADMLADRNAVRALTLALGAALAAPMVPGCGGPGTPGPASAGSSPLGVQSNVTHTEVTLRMRPEGPLAFATQLRVRFQSELLGQPLDADLETVGIRRVLDRREDGSLQLEEIDTRSRFTLSMMGRSRTTPETPRPPEARRYVMGERGRYVEEPQAAAASPAPPGERDVPRGLERALEPLARALEYPVEPVAPGAEWSSAGSIPLGEVEADMRGEARYTIAQRLERFEGTGEARLAIISFTGSLEGQGESVAPPTPGDGAPPPGGVRGQLRFRGFYAVALADGFARTARAEFEGEAQMGPEGLMRFPIRGELEWSAAPIAEALPATASAAP
jgi:hypothetical protein